MVSTSPEEFPQQYRSADRGGQLFEIGSFSKTLGPGWRVGWIISGSEEIQAITSFRRSIDGHPSTIAQYVISELLEDHAWYASLLDRERRLYADKAGALYAAIASAFDGEVELDEPQGGYFLWTHLPDDIDLDDSRVRDELEIRGLRYVPGMPSPSRIRRLDQGAYPERQVHPTPFDYHSPTHPGRSW